MCDNTKEKQKLKNAALFSFLFQWYLLFNLSEILDSENKFLRYLSKRATNLFR